MRMGNYDSQVKFKIAATEDGDLMEAFTSGNIIDNSAALTALAGSSTQQDQPSNTHSALSAAKALSTTTMRRFSFWSVILSTSGSALFRHEPSNSFYRIETYLVPIKPHFASLY